MKAKFEQIYNELKGEYVGYIQLSDEKLRKEYVFKDFTKLKPLNFSKSYVIQACFFDGNNCIDIRQTNDDYKVVKVSLDEIEKENKTSECFLTNGYGRVKIVTIWEELEDECSSQDGKKLKVLRPTKQVFAGFAGDNDAK